MLHFTCTQSFFLCPVALNQAGQHMEDSIVASYTALLLGILAKHNQVSAIHFIRWDVTSTRTAGRLGGQRHLSRWYSYVQIVMHRYGIWLIFRWPCICWFQLPIWYTTLFKFCAYFYNFTDVTI